MDLNSSSRAVLDHSCPYLGLNDDPYTALATPAVWNLCHHANPPAPAKSDYQGRVCLTARHSNCPVFQRTALEPLPLEMRSTMMQTRRDPLLRTLLAVLALLAVGLLAWWLWTLGGAGSQLPHPAEGNPPPAYQAPPAQSAPVAAVKTTGPTRAPTSRPESTPHAAAAADTPFVSSHTLDTPIGREVKFLIHRVQSGESLGTYAAQYGTSTEAILAVNSLMPMPLWIDWPVIIPFEFKEVEGLPAFEAYLVTEDGQTVSVLAGKLSASLAELMYYNNIQEDYRLSAGEWLLVPRSRPTP